MASLATLRAALARASASAAAAATTASSLVRSVSEAKASKYLAYKFTIILLDVSERDVNIRMFSYLSGRTNGLCIIPLSV